MLFKNYFNTLVFPLFFLMPTQAAIASIVESLCGENIFLVKIFDGTDAFEQRYELYYKADNEPKKIFYKTKPGVSIFTACIKNKKEQSLMIFQESYRGNVGPEDLYGVFDPNQKKLLIKPSDWPKGNFKQVEKLIGAPPPFLTGDDGTFFCCFKRQSAH